MFFAGSVGGPLHLGPRQTGELGAPACANHLEAFRALAQALGALWGERLYREAKKEDKQ